ncbi:alpha-D-ribose 1-methylphosphonate 5-phosphate C-P-lyase PhnJ [Escherichia coli]
MANLSGYNFAYLDEQTKRMIRRAILKAVAVPSGAVWRARDADNVTAGRVGEDTASPA